MWDALITSQPQQGRWPPPRSLEKCFSSKVLPFLQSCHRALFVLKPTLATRALGAAVVSLSPVAQTQTCFTPTP